MYERLIAKPGEVIEATSVNLLRKKSQERLILGNATWLSQEIGWEIDFEKKVFGNSLFGRMIWSQGECKKPVHLNY